MAESAPSLSLRRAHFGDARSVAQIVAAVAPEGSLGAEAPVDVDERARRWRSMLESDERAASWVLEQDGRIVGMANVHERARGVLMLGMAILPEARGQGAGGRLVQAGLDHARAVGAHKVELEAWVDNARAIALYSSAGFEVEGIRRDHYLRRDGRLRSTILMARRVT